MVIASPSGDLLRSPKRKGDNNEGRNPHQRLVSGVRNKIIPVCIRGAPTRLKVLHVYQVLSASLRATAPPVSSAEFYSLKEVEESISFGVVGEQSDVWSWRREGTLVWKDSNMDKPTSGIGPYSRLLSQVYHQHSAPEAMSFDVYTHFYIIVSLWTPVRRTNIPAIRRRSCLVQ